MFNLEQAIADWRRQMVIAGVRTPIILDELEGHLRDDVEAQVRAGLNLQEAFAAAAERIGVSNALQSEFKKLGGPKRRLLRRLQNALFGFKKLPFAFPSNFNRSAIETLELARLEPLRFGHDFIGTEHVLLGILKAEGGIVSKILKRMGVDHAVITAEIAAIVGTGPLRDARVAIPYTPRARKALALAGDEAKALKRSEIGPEHIFLGLLQEGGGVAALVLTKLGVKIGAARNAVRHELGAD
jgi:hypothetical protein